jgi:hypothetical protein
MDELQPAIGPAERTLTVDHDREELETPAQAPRGPQLGQRLCPSAGAVRGDPRCLPDHADPGRQLACGLGECVTALGVFGEFCGDEIPGNAVSEIGRQRAQLIARLLVKLLGGDLFGDGGAGLRTLAI